MELVLGALHTPFPMTDASRVGEARRHASLLAARAGLDETCAGRLAIVVTELGNNLVRHAKEGQLLLAARVDSGEVEVICIDHGPGIPDVARSLSDGYSTGGTPGTGLGAVRRLSQDFEVHSVVDEGTVMVSRVRAMGSTATAQPHGIICGGICIAKDGEIVCGDAWAAGLNGTRASVILADGLGHGPDAAAASEAAVDVFRIEPLAPPSALLERLHAHLRSTRGAAISILHMDTADDTIRSCGAGNVAARVVSGVSDRSVISQHGTVGLQIRRPEEAKTAWPPHALLLVHSDGIEMRWNPERLKPVLGRDPTLAAAILMRDHCRGRDDATIVVMRRKD